MLTCWQYIYKGFWEFSKNGESAGIFLVHNPKKAYIYDCYAHLTKSVLSGFCLDTLCFNFLVDDQERLELINEAKDLIDPKVVKAAESVMAPKAETDVEWSNRGDKLVFGWDRGMEICGFYPQGDGVFELRLLGRSVLVFRDFFDFCRWREDSFFRNTGLGYMWDLAVRHSSFYPEIIQEFLVSVFSSDERLCEYIKGSMYLFRDKPSNDGPC